MKVLLIADHRSPHVIKWAHSIKEESNDLVVFSLREGDEKVEKDYFDVGIKVYTMPLNKQKKDFLSKLSYLKARKKIKQIILQEKPDIINAHYLTSYGLLSILSAGNVPVLISVWGSDVMQFPYRSFLHKSLVNFILNKATAVSVTSYELKKHVNLYRKENVYVIPFGIDTEEFKKRVTSFDEGKITIGSIKQLEPIYNIDKLISVFKELSDEFDNVELLLVGSGNEEVYLKHMVREFGIEAKVVFCGWIHTDKIPEYHNRIDVFANLSENESFGVSVIEASATETPVIVANVGGLKEVVKDKETGFLVTVEDRRELVEKFRILIQNRNLRLDMGKKGREFVLKNYSQSVCVKELLKVYHELTS